MVSACRDWVDTITRRLLGNHSTLLVPVHGRGSEDLLWIALPLDNTDSLPSVQSARHSL